VVLGKQYIPLGQVTLLVTFGDVNNYHIKTLAFEVVKFSGPYHVIQGQPCYVKFMAIHSYSYLKLKIPELTRVITMDARAQQALDYEQSSIELATAMIAVTEVMEPSLQLPVPLLNLEMPSTCIAFKADEDAKAVQIEAGSLTRTVQIETSLDPK
jgi:hypothetical protein